MDKKDSTGYEAMNKKTVYLSSLRRPSSVQSALDRKVQNYWYKNGDIYHELWVKNVIIVFFLKNYNEKFFLSEL